MSTTLEKLSTDSKKIQKQIRKMAQDKVKPALQEAFSELKAVVPTLEAIRWTQFTPYFNDGDVCEFGLNEVCFRVQGMPDDVGDYGTGFEDVYNIDEYGPDKSQVDAMKRFSKALGGTESLLQEALGDHAQVTLSEDGIEVERYEHD